jgi:DNA-binding Lrp family transcriptional regulator
MAVSTAAGSGRLDLDDYRVIRALQLSPREGFARLSTVLGVSDATVARRYGRLRRSGVLRVVGIVDPGVLGQSEWIVRVQCRPDGTPAVAEALALRDDVSWVSLNAAGSEVTCVVRSRSREDREHLLVELLPRVATVLSLRASVIMHVFTTVGQQDWTVLDQALTEAEAGALRPVDPSRSPASTDVSLQPHDEAILLGLAADGRASHADLATAAGISPARTARRVRTLIETGVVRLDVELSRAALGFTTLADLWLQVAPDAVRAVGKELGMMPEVAFAAAISGVHNVHAAVNCRDLQDLFGFVTDRIGALRGVQSLEVSPVLRQLKQFNTLIKGDRLSGSR